MRGSDQSRLATNCPADTRPDAASSASEISCSTDRSTGPSTPRLYGRPAALPGRRRQPVDDRPGRPQLVFRRVVWHRAAVGQDEAAPAPDLLERVAHLGLHLFLAAA